MFECLGGEKLTNTSGDKWNNLDGLRSNEVVDWDEYENIEGQCNQYYTGNVGWKTGMQGTNSSGLNLIPSGYSYRSNIGISKLIGSHDAVLLTSDYKLIYFVGDNSYYDVEITGNISDLGFASIILVKSN